MKGQWLAAIFVASLGVQACQIAKPASASSQPPPARDSKPGAPKPDFETDIKPIFQARCQPCHFQGGKVYEKLPFDKPETITKLGTRLFTRIKDEKEQQRIREFLEK
jgi:hypothetical protein